MSLTITRSLEFDAGHRVLNHESKCAHLHGHRYKAELKVGGDLDNIGRVIDFGVIKTVVGRWIDDNWDHNMILHPHDPLVRWKRQTVVAPAAFMKTLDAIWGGKEPFIMPTDDVYAEDPYANPTAENMARVLAYKAQDLLRPYMIEVHQVRLYETPNCYAEFCFE